MNSNDLVRTFDASALKAFEGNIVWRSFVATIQDRLDLIRDELESGVSTVGVGRDARTVIIDNEGLKRRQGECISLRYLLALPETIKQVWAQDEEFNKKKEE